MPKRLPQRKMGASASRKPTFLKHWRKHRKLSQEKAAERIGVSQATLSKIERGELPYNQDLLEAAAAAYGAQDAADLLQINPLAVDTLGVLLTRLRSATPDLQRRTQAVVEALLKAS